MRRPLLTLALGLTAIAAGCGAIDEDTPAACLAPAGSYLGALRDAPATVRLAGETPISECLTKDQAPAPLAEVGRSMVAAATELNARARREDGGAATVRLGYLVGAARRGAGDTAGIHTDLLRRLDAAALFSRSGATHSPSFRAAYDRGYAAGEKTG